MDQNPHQPSSKFQLSKNPVFKHGFALFQLPSRDIGRLFNMDLVAVTFTEEKASSTSRTVFGVVKDNFNVFFIHNETRLKSGSRKEIFQNFPSTALLRRFYLSAP
jgi:hypothetical protein